MFSALATRSRFMLPTTIIGFDIHSFRKEFCFTTVESIRRSLPAMIDPALTSPVLLICPQVGQARQLLTRPRTHETREGSGGESLPAPWQTHARLPIELKGPAATNRWV